MLVNYLKIAWRNLLKYKLFSLINILGLSLAIPTALMSLIQIVNYYEYDKFHQDSEQIVRVNTDEKDKNGEIVKWASSPFLLGNYIKENLAVVEQSTTIVRDFNWVLGNGIKTKKTDAIYADASFFNVFNFPLEKGTYPLEPNTIVLTQETAEWFFKDANPVGSILEHPKYGSFKVVGVLKPFNQMKTQFRTDVLVLIKDYAGNDAQDWTALKAHTFVKLSKGRSTAEFDKQLSQTAAGVNKLIGTAAGKNLSFKSQYLDDISPAKEILENDPHIQDIRSIYINFAFQLIMIVLAALNYINLTLARSMSRSREVGVRKVMGATKPQLVLQFLTESVLISYLALAVGLIMLWFIKTNMHVSWLTWDIDHFGYLIMLFLVFNLVLGLVAGASPSLILSSYQPVKVLKGSTGPVGFRKIGLRKSLIVVQFVIALVYIFFIGQIFYQINYMATDNENYNRENIFNLNLTGNKGHLLAADIKAMKEIQKVGYTSLSFGNKPVHSAIKSTKNDVPRPAFYYAADHNFIENMGLKIVAGTNLIESNAEKPSPLVVVNQKAIENLRIGTLQEAIGKQFLVNDTLSATIIGVIENFCHYDYEAKIEPIVFQYQPALFKVMCMKTSPVADRKGLEADIEKIWRKHNPYLDVNASWLDTDLYEIYFPFDYLKFMSMEGIVIFVIAILGLIGILTYSLEKRTKEIGIRKVMGATIAEIIKLMSADFIRLLSVASIIAIPLGVAVGWFMNTYYVYNKGIGYTIMCVLLSIVIGVALSAIGYFSWKVAQTNPAKTLKTE
jgi:putative ABC transport system permease protein